MGSKKGSAIATQGKLGIRCYCGIPLQTDWMDSGLMETLSLAQVE